METYSVSFACFRSFLAKQQTPSCRNGDDPALASNPAPVEIKAARLAAELTQTAAAALINTSCRNWRQRNPGDRQIHPAFFGFFRQKLDAGNLPHKTEAAKPPVRNLEVGLHDVEDK